jgi:hypothetical protein
MRMKAWGSSAIAAVAWVGVGCGGNMNVNGTFEATPPLETAPAPIEVEFVGKGTGRVTSTPAGIDCPGTCTMPFTGEAGVSLHVAPDENSEFIGWGGGCSGNGACVVTPTGGHKVWVHLEPKGGPPPSESCAGIAAPDDVAIQEYVAAAKPGTCGPGTGDAKGTLAFLRHAGGPNTHVDSIEFFGSEKVLLGAAQPNMGAKSFPQPGGFSILASSPYLGPLANNTTQLMNVDSTGKVVGETLLFGQLLELKAAPHPANGIAIAGDFALTKNDPEQGPIPSGPKEHAVVMFSGAGTTPKVEWGPEKLDSTGTVLAVAVDLLGRTLVITDGAPSYGSGKVSGQWFDTDGAALTEEFVLLSRFVPGASTWFEAAPLIGSGVVVQRFDRSGGAVIAEAQVVVTSGSTEVHPAPGWMMVRPDASLQIARGGQAYAVLPLGAKGVDCTQRVEIVAPDGTRCGTRDFKIADGTCDTHDLTLGLDGTVIQRLPDAMESKSETTGDTTCTWRWWAGAVR